MATVGKVRVEPNGVNAIPSSVTAWLDARGRGRRTPCAGWSTTSPRRPGRTPSRSRGRASTDFDADLRDRLAAALGDVPVLATGAGHDAGILSAAGIPTAMLFVRNPTGVTHSPAEHADEADCLAGVAALAGVVEELA